MSSALAITHHVSVAVVKHKFVSPEDWAKALLELSEMDDQDISRLVQGEKDEKDDDGRS